VRGINLEIRPGELFGLLGQNGAGKTTTIHMLSTLLQPTSGSARVNGFDVVSRPVDVRRGIGLVFQDSALDRDLTVSENLAFICALHGVKRSEAGRRIDRILGILRLDAFRNTLVKKLSGGLRRRVDIAHGILHDAQILFLDEPTIGLDPQARMELWNFIDVLRKERALTVLLTTHYMEEAERCERVGIMHEGRMAGLGTPLDLTRSILPGAQQSSLNDVFVRLAGGVGAVS
jgi:ABC-2 type transport system ATP-binding protein